MDLAGGAGVFEEPACKTNRDKSTKERAKGCPAPTPGATAGGCAFDGAMITLVPIVDAAHVVHGPIACCGNSWNSRGSRSSGPSLYRRGFTTDAGEHDVIFGGERKLYDTIVEVAERHAPAAVFVYSTCVTALIGDDIDAVCAAAASATGLPVVPVHAPGFVGSKSLGNRLAGEALMAHVVGTQEPPVRTSFDIALLGEHNIAGELWDVLPVLDRVGVRVLSTVSGDARFAEVAWAHRARATMVVCSKALLGMARALQARYGIPWFEGSFYGARSMGNAIRSMVQILNDPSLGERAERVIAEEEAALASRLAPYTARLAGRRAVLYTGGVKSWSIVSALQDLGIDVVATGVKKSTEEDVARIRDLLGTDAILLRTGDPDSLLRVAHETGADIVIAGGRNQYTALKGRLPFLDINQERHTAYAGYTGMIDLARRIDLAMSSPVWDQVRRPAPWDDHGLARASVPGHGQAQKKRTSEQTSTPTQSGTPGQITATGQISTMAREVA